MSSSNTKKTDSAPPGYTPAHRVPTDSSYYSFDGNPWNNKDPDSQTWMYAREARQQQDGVPAGKRLPYPSRFGNGEVLPLSTPGTSKHGRSEWLHHPLIPGRSNTWVPYRRDPVGGVRSFYTEGDTSQFDVGFHDPKIPGYPKGREPFSLARYHAGVRPPRSSTN
ncbi:hypothetical protein F5Y04DRAFT_261263 [Hypomontagnella monticulosa]|nr:hypothetical protein F5Y04DRAFT_261263 [Hypomontagnella monticulosa]